MGWKQSEVRVPKKWFRHKCPVCGLCFILGYSMRHHMGWHKRQCRILCYTGKTSIGVRFDE